MTVCTQHAPDPHRSRSPETTSVPWKVGMSLFLIAFVARGDVGATDRPNTSVLDKRGSVERIAAIHEGYDSDIASCRITFYLFRQGTAAVKHQSTAEDVSAFIAASELSSGTLDSFKRFAESYLGSRLDERGLAKLKGSFQMRGSATREECCGFIHTFNGSDVISTDLDNHQVMVGPRSSLFELKSGRSVTYGQAMAVGFKKWGPLLVARIVAGLLTFLGLLAFMIPGVMLGVRYSMVDAAVIIDGRTGSDALARSVKLTAGRRWQIFGSAVLFFVGFMVLSIGAYLPLAFIESFDTMPIEIMLDCILDIVYAVIQIVIFRYYWEATQRDREPEPRDASPDDIERGLPFSFPAGADDNPYRSPLSG